MNQRIYHRRELKHNENIALKCSFLNPLYKVSNKGIHTIHLLSLPSTSIFGSFISSVLILCGV